VLGKPKLRTVDDYLETQWKKLREDEKALFDTYRTLDDRCKSANPAPVRQCRDAVLAELERQWQRITEFAEAHPEFSEEWVE
jgi:hypothetical protein